jgi:hypothetical protein
MIARAKLALAIGTLLVASTGLAAATGALGPRSIWGGENPGQGASHAAMPPAGAEHNNAGVNHTDNRNHDRNETGGHDDNETDDDDENETGGGDHDHNETGDDDENETGELTATGYRFAPSPMNYGTAYNASGDGNWSRNWTRGNVSCSGSGNRTSGSITCSWPGGNFTRGNLTCTWTGGSVTFSWGPHFHNMTWAGGSFSCTWTGGSWSRSGDDRSDGGAGTEGAATSDARA